MKFTWSPSFNLCHFFYVFPLLTALICIRFIFQRSLRLDSLFSNPPRTSHRCLSVFIYWVIYANSVDGTATIAVLWLCCNSNLKRKKISLIIICINFGFVWMGWCETNWIVRLWNATTHKSYRSFSILDFYRFEFSIEWQNDSGHLTTNERQIDVQWKSIDFDWNWTGSSGFSDMWEIEIKLSLESAVVIDTTRYTRIELKLIPRWRSECFPFFSIISFCLFHLSNCDVAEVRIELFKFNNNNNNNIIIHYVMGAWHAD